MNVSMHQNVHVMVTCGCLASQKRTVNVNLFGFTDMSEEGGFWRKDMWLGTIWWLILAEMSKRSEIK